MGEVARGAGQVMSLPCFLRFGTSRFLCELKEREYRAKRISLFMRMLARQEECLEFDPALFTAFVEKVVVSGTKKDVQLVYVLKDGTEYNMEELRYSSTSFSH